MFRLGLLSLTVIAGGLMLGSSAVSAQTAGQTVGSYGYQCFSTMDGVQHCSCDSFNTSDDAYNWMFNQLGTLVDNGSGNATMSSHSDVVVQTQVTNCVP